MTHDPSPADDVALDRAAAAAVLSGNTEAFAGIVARHQRRIFTVTLMIVRDPSAAEEAAQDAFVRAFRHLAQYDAARPLYPWLAAIAVRAAQNRRQTLFRHRGVEDTANQTERIADAASDPLDELIAGERDRRLWRAVSRLPDRERTAALLHYRQDMRIEDVARALGVTAGTVKTFLFRARRRLKAMAAEVEAAEGTR